MPQLDKLSFLSQFFWLSFFFIGFYILLGKTFLPQVNQILKVRQKKMGFSRTGGGLSVLEGFSLIQNETIKIKHNQENLYLRSIKNSKELFTQSSQNTINWSNKTVAFFNEQSLKLLHVTYIETLGKISFSNNLILNIFQILLPPTSCSNIQNCGNEAREDAFNTSLFLFITEE